MSEEEFPEDENSDSVTEKLEKTSSEFEDEFEDEAGATEEDKAAEIESVQEIKEFVPEPVEVKSFKEKLNNVKENLLSRIMSAVSLLSSWYKTIKNFNLKIGGKKYSVYFICKTLIVLIFSIIVLSHAYSYYKFLNSVFDDSFLAERNAEPLLDEEEELGSEDFALLDDEDTGEGIDEIGVIFEIKNILLNIRHMGSGHYSLLKISMGLELDSEYLMDELNSRKKQLQHLIIINLSNKYFHEIRDIKKRKKLKSLIKNKLNGFLKTGSVRRIFFTELVFN